MHDWDHAGSLNHSNAISQYWPNYDEDIFFYHELHNIDPKVLVHHRVQSDAGVAKKIQNAWIRCVYHKLNVILRWVP